MNFRRQSKNSKQLQVNSKAYALLCRQIHTLSISLLWNSSYMNFQDEKRPKMKLKKGMQLAWTSSSQTLTSYRQWRHWACKGGTESNYTYKSTCMLVYTGTFMCVKPLLMKNIRFIHVHAKLVRMLRNTVHNWINGGKRKTKPFHDSRSCWEWMTDKSTRGGWKGERIYCHVR